MNMEEIYSFDAEFEEFQIDNDAVYISNVSGEFVEIYVCNFENSKVQNWQFSIL